MACELIDAADADAYLADKAYDSNAIRAHIQAKGAEIVIPSNRSRKAPIPYDKHIYKERHTVENFFQRIKRYRKIATRYAQLAEMYLQAVQLVAIVDWLR